MPSPKAMGFLGSAGGATGGYLPAAPTFARIPSASAERLETQRPSNFRRLGGLCLSSTCMATCNSKDRGRHAILAWVMPSAVALVVATFARLGFSADAFAWAAVQVGFVGVAAYDVATRRIKNVVTIPGSLLALLLRAVFDRSALGEVVIAGLLAFLFFLVLAIVSRGGIGMGDVKLAAMLGFLLGSAVVPALVVGTVAGGIVSATMIARSPSARRRHIAYGPFLAFGGAVAILAFSPPSLV
jgi:prepilin signal peptidase PulO-like enzyme (type II secretory pathway)